MRRGRSSVRDAQAKSARAHGLRPCRPRGRHGPQASGAPAGTVGPQSGGRVVALRRLGEMHWRGWRSSRQQPLQRRRRHPGMAAAAVRALPGCRAFVRSLRVGARLACVLPMQAGHVAVVAKVCRFMSVMPAQAGRCRPGPLEQQGGHEDGECGETVPGHGGGLGRSDAKRRVALWTLRTLGTWPRPLTDRNMTNLSSRKITAFTDNAPHETAGRRR